jgi:hypothetical protein
MTTYAAIIADNLATLYARDLAERAGAMGAGLQGGTLKLRAFGADCRIDREGIALDGNHETGPRGIIVSLYALHAAAEACTREPFKSFKQLPGSMPYAGAFADRTEQALVPAVESIFAARPAILAQLAGCEAPQLAAGDFAFVVHPLPKIALCYLFYRADDEFPASVTCLYAHNTERFMPTDGLADVGEYTSKAILETIQPQLQTR